MPEGQLLEPQQYDIVWAIIAIGLLVIAALFYFLLFLFTKKMKPEEEVEPLKPEVVNYYDWSKVLKDKYIKRVEVIDKNYEDGKISNRKAFQELGALLRNFTHEYSGSGAFAMGLVDLEKEKAPELLVDKIRNFYPLAFEEANRTGDVKLASDDALKVINIWH